MRLLVASDQWSPDAIGGSARVAADTARALAARGHAVSAIVPAQPDRPARALEDGVEVLRVLRRGRLPQTIGDRLQTRRAARSLPSSSFDILVGHQSSTAAGLAAGMPELPLALVFHASAVLERRYLRSRASGRERVLLGALEPALVAFERRAVTRAAAILVLSEYSRELVLSRHPDAADRIRQVRGGVGSAFLAPPRETAAAVRARHGIPPEAVFLLTTRRLEPRMGLEELIAALASVADERFVLAVTGDGAGRAALEDLVRSLSLNERVRFLGRVDEDELRSLYAAADLFVLPTVAYEGFGMSTIEALASGTPVLGTAVGATPEILAPLDAALIVPRADSAAIAEGLRRIVPRLTPELRSRCASWARAEYAWQEAIEPWEAALERAIDAKRVAGNL
ncbi:Glycosyltransferase [Gaiella occulta]|uniref:Glycosyltransferase n=1 Tax=Gaiella occulta TaxID=1002870 RepID=A0A7M2YXT8_9ACTN|nr:glycosyltransferase family 4 protein [Gaiella occulta]RDI74866.1 Glycosyltransferase [Gaiella occulta]